MAGTGPFVEGVYQPWEQGASGRWRGKRIAVEIGLEGALATVYAHDGRRMLHEGEVTEELRRRDEEKEAALTSESSLGLYRVCEKLLARRSPGIRRQGGTARDAGASSGPNRR